MKKILVPTDFSDNATAALVYACNLALDIKAEIILLNVFQVPSAQSNVMINFSDLLEEDSKKDLQKSIDEIRKDMNFSKVNITPKSAYGFLTDVLGNITTNEKIDLIVMGTTGAGSIGNKLFGSNTIATLKKVETPVLAIPEKAEYNYWKHIVFATNIENQKNDMHFKPLSELIDLKQTELSVVSVNTQVNLDKEGVYERIYNQINTSFELKIIQNENVVDGILDYIENQPSDLLVLIRKDYSFFENLFHSSVTRKLALHAKIPMLLYKG